MKPAGPPGLHVPTLILRARLALAAFGAVRGIALVFILLGAGLILWLLPQPARLAEAHLQALRAIRTPPVVAVSAPLLANQNLALFYASLGEARYAEQQVRTLFALAAKSGLSLSQGEYRSAYDKAGQLSTYQITLPVKGNYRAIWQFGMLALRAMPFASLDEISFKRESVTDVNVEARLRFTLYLGGGAR
jgi:hypothetical protein